MLRKLLSHPATRDLELDDPATTKVRRKIIQEKVFLRKIYAEWYQSIAAELPPGEKRVLEIGSGAGFCSDYIPHLITSEILEAKGVDLRLNALHLPIENAGLKAIVMTDALHHIPDVEKFFSEAIRCLIQGGAIIMVEPWVSSWSRFVYSTFHHEPFDPDAKNWSFSSTGPLSSANGALPWILFERDRSSFEHAFPQLKIQSIQGLMPFSYLLSGGTSMRSFIPGFAYRFCRSLENLLPMYYWAMFAKIVIVRA